jgi:hypothetical protein
MPAGVKRSLRAGFSNDRSLPLYPGFRSVPAAPEVSACAHADALRFGFVRHVSPVDLKFGMAMRREAGCVADAQAGHWVYSAVTDLNRIQEAPD